MTPEPSLASRLLALADPWAALGPAPGPEAEPGAAASPEAIELAGRLRSIRTMLSDRAVIEQAKGMLMASNRIDADQAYRILCAESQYTNVKVREVAARHIALRGPIRRIAANSASR